MTPVTKQEWRTRVLAARSALSPAARAAEAVALAAHVRTLVGPGATVCAHVPVGTEPGSTALLDGLVRVGARVLLPVAREPAALRWAVFAGVDALVAAPLGLREPAGPVLGAEEVAGADVVLVPALAVGRRGVRLGRGAGYYDRTLALAGPGARLVAVVRDTELVEQLPGESHDVPLGWAVTPVGGLVRLGA